MSDDDADASALSASAPIVVFSKSYCPYCTNAKRALEQAGVASDEIQVLELDERPDGDEIQSQLAALTGSRTVPQVFVGGEYIGGGDDTVALQRSGKLASLCQAAGVSGVRAAASTTRPVTEQMEDAVQGFRMISESEAGVRKIAGVVVGLVLAIAHLVAPDYVTSGAFALFSGAAIGTYRTGVYNQWGCIVNGRWNIDGKGFRRIPVDKGNKFANFLKEKQQQFAMNIATSFAAAIAFGGLYGTLVREEELISALTEGSLWMLGGLVGTAVLSLAAK